MCDRDDGTLSELLFNQLLDLLLGDDVNVGRCLVKYDNLVFPQDCTTDAKQLLLSSAKICSSFTDLEVDALTLLLSFLSFTPRCIQVISGLQARNLCLILLLLVLLASGRLWFATK